MRVSLCIATVAVAMLPGLVAAQSSSSPVADAFRDNASRVSKNLIAAAETMPADKYSFKPTPAQMSFGQIVVHLSQGNDYLCGAIGGEKAPTRTKIADTASKEELVARLKETFAFCDQALAKLDDSKLSEQLPFFGGKTRSRAAIMTLTTGDWADHYSQSSVYLRMNGELPPTAKGKQAD
ncbi:MAG TPA: DinB family protein [Gemmatimonadaceae bacterium]|nr:DinB family protein [Gemmatimonadaceae bacterium]